MESRCAQWSDGSVKRSGGRLCLVRLRQLPTFVSGDIDGQLRTLCCWGTHIFCCARCTLRGIALTVDAVVNDEISISNRRTPTLSASSATRNTIATPETVSIHGRQSSVSRSSQTCPSSISAFVNGELSPSPANADGCSARAGACARLRRCVSLGVRGLNLPVNNRRPCSQPLRLIAMAWSPAGIVSPMMISTDACGATQLAVAGTLREKRGHAACLCAAIVIAKGHRCPPAVSVVSADAPTLS